MPYIGKQPLTGAYQLCDTITTSATATYNLLVGGSGVIPGSANNCIVSLNGVVQAPVSAFTVSGSTITFASTLSATDVIDFILILGNVFDIGKPTNGTVTNASLANGATGIIAWQSVKTGNFTAVAGEGYFVNTTSGEITVTLPSGTPAAGSQVVIIDYAGTADTNKIVINPNGNKIEGAAGNVQLTGEREGVTLTYVDSTQGWLATSGINEGTDALLPAPYSADFLVIAGGGGSVVNAPGGSGAGGYRSSNATYGGSGGGASAEASLTFNPGTVYTVTVGAGGASNTDGANSSISGTGITTITSTGGGKGGSSGGIGSTGGSGGGGGEFAASGAAGTANQGFAGGGGNGGGGGAGGTGFNGFGLGVNLANSGGFGGAGKASTITGSSVTRASGGAGYYAAPGAVQSPNVTGGGGGSTTPAGAANTGGGAAADYLATSGGSGVVILRMPTVNYSGTTTGSPTVSTSGTDTILTFTGSGSYTG